MEYLSIKQLSAKFAMPARTVYHHVANNPNIRIKKQGRMKLANVSDFAKACNRDLQPLQWIAIEEPKDQSNHKFASFQKSLQDLQQEGQLSKEKIFSLQKVNTNLETTRNKFIKLYTEEKEQRADLREKYDTLQETYHREVQSFLKKYYLSLGFCMVCIILLLVLNLSQILERFKLLG